MNPDIGKLKDHEEERVRDKTILSVKKDLNFVLTAFHP